MSTRAEPKSVLATELRPFENRNTSWGLATWLLTFIPFLSLVEILARLFQNGASWWGLLGIYLSAVLFHARLFVLMHDCGHDRLTASHRLNVWIGHLCAFTYAVPFLFWRDLHNQHHRHQGNLDRKKEYFDLWTWTVTEYQAATWPKKLFYRFYRHPVSLFLLGPGLFFIFFLRWPPQKKSPAALKNILFLNFILLGLIFASVDNHELRLRLLTLLSIAAFNFSVAVWFFYQQHVFADTYWARETRFNKEDVSFLGSSFIVFPQFLDWFAASIGHHHIHHLNTKIPYYHLKRARQHLLDQGRLVHEKRLRFKEMIKSIKLKIWCEKKEKMVSFSAISASAATPNVRNQRKLKTEIVSKNSN